MDISRLRDLTTEELRALYRVFLSGKNYNKTTIDTACSDSFYLWNKGSKDLFWNVILSSDFEREGKEALQKLLSENSTGEAKQRVSSYMSHLRRFRQFLPSYGTVQPILAKKEGTLKHLKSNREIKVDIPSPSKEQMDYYLNKWLELENYRLQEDALDKLFFELCPQNIDIADILLKASTLNNFYSTNIFSIYPVAKHILMLNIDSRLKSGDTSLVSDIQQIIIGDKKKNFYSFATKYCSHHNPLDYPIYDSFVDEVLRYFRNRDGFSNFTDIDLKNYGKFKSVLLDFQRFYSLEEYNLKQIDQYIWQLGKDYFPRNYGKKKERDKKS